MDSNLLAMASNLLAMASNLLAMDSNLLAMDSNLLAMASMNTTSQEAVHRAETREIGQKSLSVNNNKQKEMVGLCWTFKLLRLRICPKRHL